jgi:hypothetical protein
MTLNASCSECGSKDLYYHCTTGGDFNPLPDLGSFLAFATMFVVVCSNCGLIRFFADEDARKKLPESKKWRKLA